MAAEARIREAKTGDVFGIVELLRDDALGRAREAEPDDRRYIEAFEAIACDPNNTIFVMERDGVLIGCAQLTIIPGLSRRGLLRGQIESVRIASSERGQGAGRELFDFLIAEASRRGCGLVQLTTDKMRPDAHRFYEALGFRASHEGYKLSLS